MRAGETIVVGGITYDQLSNNFTNLPGFEKLPTGSKASTTTKHAIYIVVRPTVVIFTKNAAELNRRAAQLDQILSRPSQAEPILIEPAAVPPATPRKDPAIVAPAAGPVMGEPWYEAVPRTAAPVATPVSNTVSAAQPAPAQPKPQPTADTASNEVEMMKSPHPHIRIHEYPVKASTYPVQGVN